MLRPAPIHRAKPADLLRSVLFRDQTGFSPWVLFRSGEEQRAYYDGSLLAWPDSFDLTLPVEAIKSARDARAICDGIIAKLDYSYVTVAPAVSGWASLAALRYPKEGTAFRALTAHNDELGLGKPSLVLVGPRWRRSERQRKVLGALPSPGGGAGLSGDSFPRWDAARRAFEIDRPSRAFGASAMKVIDELMPTKKEEDELRKEKLRMPKARK